MKRKYLAASDPPDGWCAVLRDRTYAQKNPFIFLYIYVYIDIYPYGGPCESPNLQYGGSCGPPSM
jgi:hypothetical protein